MLFSYLVIHFQRTMMSQLPFSVSVKCLKVKDRRTITDKVKQVINHYKTHVYNEKNCTKPNKKGTVFVKKSIRILNQEWRQMSMKVTKNCKPMSVPINDLLKSGKDMDSLTGIKKDFYIDQIAHELGALVSRLMLIMQQKRQLNVPQHWLLND